MALAKNLRLRPAGIAYFCDLHRTRPHPARAELIVLDIQLAPLTLEIFGITITRLTELGQRLGALGQLVLTTSPLAREMQQSGVPVEIIDPLLAEDPALLALGASIHIQSDKVKVTDAVQLASERLPGLLSPTAPFDEDNPARSAFLYGVALGLDPGRSLSSGPKRRSVNANRR